MFDHNPFREYKEMMKAKRLEESSEEQQYSPLNVVRDPKSTSDELHTAMDIFRQHAINYYNQHGSHIPSSRDFYVELENHPNFDKTHDEKIPFVPGHREWEPRPRGDEGGD